MITGYLPQLGAGPSWHLVVRSTGTQAAALVYPYLGKGNYKCIVWSL